MYVSKLYVSLKSYGIKFQSVWVIGLLSYGHTGSWNNLKFILWKWKWNLILWICITFNLFGRRIVWALSLDGLNWITYHNLTGETACWKRTYWILSVVMWVTICWWPLFLNWMLLLVVLQTLDSTGKYIKEYTCPAYICAFLACVGRWNSLQIKYLFTRGIFISVSLRLMLLLGVVRAM